MKGAYTLRLRCAGCGKYLFGDVGRYRHPPPTCEDFKVASPGERQRYRKPNDSRAKGHSYPKDWYGDAIGELLGGIGSLDDHTMIEVVRLYGQDLAKPDELTLARIDRERDEALARYRRDREADALAATMARLDEDERLAREPRDQGISAAEVVELLRDLPRLWREAPTSRAAIASALFEHIEVIGLRRAWFRLTDEAVARGFGAVMPESLSLAGYGRGERS